MSNCYTARQRTQMEPINGAYSIPTEVAIQFARDLFGDIGADRLRAHSQFISVPFEDIGDLSDDELTDAISVGLDYLTDVPAEGRPPLQAALLKRLDNQFRPSWGRFIYRVGDSRCKSWPKPVH